MLTSYDNGIKTAPLSGGWPEASGSAHSEPFLSLAPHRRGCWAPGDERTPTISPGALWGDRCLCHDFSAASCGRKEPGGKTESGSLLQGLGQQLDRCRCHRLGSEGASLWGESAFRVWAGQICDVQAMCMRHPRADFGDGEERRCRAGPRGPGCRRMCGLFTYGSGGSAPKPGAGAGNPGGEAREEAPDGAAGTAENPGRAGGNQAREPGAEGCPSPHTHMWKSYPPPPNHRMRLGLETGP